MQLLSPYIKRIDKLYFVSNELFCNSLITLLCIAKEALTALNIYCAQKYVLNCSLFIMLSTINSLNKASGLPYIFVRVIMGHTPCQLKRIGYSW